MRVSLVHSRDSFTSSWILEEMGSRKPDVVLLENVLGFASSREDDLRLAIRELNRLDYVCDVLVPLTLPGSYPKVVHVSSLSVRYAELASPSTCRPRR